MEVQLSHRALGILLLFSVVSMARAVPPASAGPGDKFAEDVLAVRSIAKQASAADAGAQLAPILQKWREVSVEQYGRLSLESCVALKDSFEASTEKAALADKISLEALAEKGLPPDIELQLVVGLSPLPSDMKPDVYAAKRTERLALLMSAWKAINSALDASFDADKRPVMNVDPPLQLSGQAPDPVAIANYRAASEKNTKYLKYYSGQTRLRSVLHGASQQWRAALVAAFASGPDGTDELSAALQSSTVEQMDRDQILAQVRAARVGDPKH